MLLPGLSMMVPLLVMVPPKLLLMIPRLLIARVPPALIVMVPPESTVTVSPEGIVTVIPIGMVTVSVDVGILPPHVELLFQFPFATAVKEVAYAL